jgi:hypothetical protein
MEHNGIKNYILRRRFFAANLILVIRLFGCLALVIFSLFLCEFLKEREWRPNTALEFFKGE